MKKCVYCEKTPCTGRIDDHCTWCGDPLLNKDVVKTYDGAFCSDKCCKDNDDWNEELKRKSVER